MIDNKTNKIEILESKELVLKPLSKEFLSIDYLKWLNDEEVTKHMESGGNFDYKTLEKYLTDVENNPKYFWAIISKNNSKHIGNIKVDPIDLNNKFGEFGIMIGDKKSWGKGYAKQASKVVLNFCFQKLKLRKINLGVLANNDSAIKLYDSLGFKLEGHFKKHILKNGKYIDVYRYSIFNPLIK